MLRRQRATVRRAVVALAVLLGLATATPVPGQQPDDRIAGADRYATSAAIAGRAFPSGATTVYVARGDVLVDALAAGVLTDGPIVLTPSCGPASPDVRAAVEAADPDRVVALGGQAAVCDAVLRELASGRRTGRLAGDSRITTAIAVAGAAFPDGAPVVYLASASAASPDAVAGGALTDGPILLVPPDGAVPREVRAAVAGFDPDLVIALGGPAALADDVLDDAAAGRRTARLAGSDRRGTAVSISRRAFPDGAPLVYLGQEQVFADAVAAGALTDAPVLLVPSCGSLPEVVANEMARLGTPRAIALGGPTAVCQSLLDEANGGDPAMPPSSTSGPVVELLHAYPRGGAPTAGVVEAIHHEVPIVADWYRTQAGGTSLRWDAVDGRLRVRTVELPISAQEMADAWRVRDALAELGLAEPVGPPGATYGDLFVVYADTVGPACGGTAGQVAILYMPSCNIYPDTATPSFPYGATYLAAHELAHALGAVPDCAPHAGNGGHVVDDPADLLYAGPSDREWGAITLDPGRDDYFRHANTGCPDIDDSPFWDR